MDKYSKAKQRIIRNTRNKNITDYEIVEELEKEIDYYRNEIRRLKEVDEEQTEELMDKDVIEIINTTKYVEGKPIETRMEYKYKDDAGKDENDCPPIIPGFHCTG